MDAFRVYIMPIDGRGDMPQGIGIVVHHHFGHACGSRCEIEQHGVLEPGCFLACRAFPVLAGRLHACREIHPAGAVLAYDDFCTSKRGFRLGFVDMVDDLGFIRADDGLDLGGVVAVNDILLHEQMRRRMTTAPILCSARMLIQNS